MKGSKTIGLEFKAGVLPGNFEATQRIDVVKGGSAVIGATIGSWSPQDDSPGPEG